MNRMEHHTRWSQVDTVAIERAKGIFVCVCVLSTVLLNEHPRLFFLQIAFSEDTDYTPRPTFAASTPCPCTRFKIYHYVLVGGQHLSSAKLTAAPSSTPPERCQGTLNSLEMDSGAGQVRQMPRGQSEPGVTWGPRGAIKD